jgi:hypothetical protein
MPVKFLRAYSGASLSLARYELDNEQLVLAYTAVGLQVLFSGSGISPNIDGISPAEILSGLLVDISRASHG